MKLVKNAWEKFQDSPETSDGRPAQIEVRFIPQDMKVLLIYLKHNKPNLLNVLGVGIP